jgi:hypothetical protein
VDTHPSEQPQGGSARASLGGLQQAEEEEEERRRQAQEQRQHQHQHQQRGLEAMAGAGAGTPAAVAYELEVLHQKVEEAELAAAVQSRRAAAAEAELAALRVELAEAQKQVRELSWQIKMAFEPQTIGGARPGLGGGSAGGWLLDMAGCGANFTRK